MSLHDQEPVKFIINWKEGKLLYARSEVTAHTKEEAEAMAHNGEDVNFEVCEPDGNWEIESIEEAE